MYKKHKKLQFLSSRIDEIVHIKSKKNVTKYKKSKNISINKEILIFI